MGFKLGQIAFTKGVWREMGDNSAFGKFVSESFVKYAHCDWGQTCDEDKALNDEAVKTGEDRILAVYETDGLPKIWIITEWDRSATTILFPSEY
jgi:hypothetical protein